MSRFLVYPYTLASIGLVKTLIALQVDYEVAVLDGNELVGKDWAYICNQTATGKIIQAIGSINVDDYKYILYLNEAVNDKNEFDSLYLSQIASFSSKIINHQDWLECLTLDNQMYTKTNKSNHIIQNVKKSLHYNCMTPCVFVCGITDYGDAHEIALLLKVEFMHRGYNVALISNDEHAKYIDGVKFPKSLGSINYTPIEQITTLNQQLEGIIQQKSPDLVIMMLPFNANPFRGTYARYNEIYLNMVKCSVLPDYIIMALPAEYAQITTEQSISRYCDRNLGKSVDAIHFTNIQIVSEEDDVADSICYVDINRYDSSIENFERSSPCLTTSLRNNAYYVELTDDIINKLSREV